MNIVIDTNIFISAIIRDGLIRKILKYSKDTFLFPDFELQEVLDNKEEIVEKSRISNKEFYILILRLLKYVKRVPVELVNEFSREACEIMKNIHIEDSVFIATALAFNCSIWSDDKHFKKQDKVKILTTKEMMRL